MIDSFRGFSFFGSFCLLSEFVGFLLGISGDCRRFFIALEYSCVGRRVLARHFLRGDGNDDRILWSVFWIETSTLMSKLFNQSPDPSLKSSPSR